MRSTEHHSSFLLLVFYVLAVQVIYQQKPWSCTSLHLSAVIVITNQNRWRTQFPHQDVIKHHISVPPLVNSSLATQNIKQAQQKCPLFNYMSSNITAEKEIESHFSHISRMTTVVSTTSQGFSPQRQTTRALRSTTERRETESSLCLLLCNC